MYRLVFGTLASLVAALTIAAALHPAAGVAAARPAVPRPVRIARTTAIPKCTVFIDGASAGPGKGTPASPHTTIAAGVKAVKPGGVVCVAEGVYRESIAPGTKPFTLAGGFEHGSLFKVRDSARFVTKAQGNGGSFVRIVDPGPRGKQLTAVDGFEISGYNQAILRDVYYSQRFDVTNNYIHDNSCDDASLAGGGFSLSNVSGVIRGNVLRRNVCGRGGAGLLYDGVDENSVVVERNLVEANSGNQPGIAHGGGLYLFTNRLTVRGNAFVKNRVTGWGAGLYIGSYAGGGMHTNADLSWNVYRGNRAGIAGGGFFCDDSAKCASDHEVYDSNCGGNIYVDSGPGTTTTFDHLTNYGALAVNCKAPGNGVQIDKGDTSNESDVFTNAIFRGNAPGHDIVASCGAGCGALQVEVSYSMIDRRTPNGGVKIRFGAGILSPRDPLFVSPETGDFHLKSRFGHWTAHGYVRDAISSPALGLGDPASPVDKQPPRAGDRTELGAYGNSPEASYVR